MDKTQEETKTGEEEQKNQKNLKLGDNEEFPILSGPKKERVQMDDVWG